MGTRSGKSLKSPIASFIRLQSTPLLLLMATLTEKHDFLPRMAKHYGFQYELVPCKWPRWLHHQFEKQRIIWGYKIFLDVVFPLDGKKIIFVDGDQVVRADMKELVDLEFSGAPYGYTPFCDSSTEMDGFRFWKSGYWRNHLQGWKYHISALYVVDLKQFRQIADGDWLRGQYQTLIQDPNSLSYLDQVMLLKPLLKANTLKPDTLNSDEFAGRNQFSGWKTTTANTMMLSNPKSLEFHLSNHRFGHDLPSRELLYELSLVCK